MKSDLVDMELHVHVETDDAILASDDGDKAKAVWLPKSQIEYGEKRVRGFVTVTMPEWLAIDKGLV